MTCSELQKLLPEIIDGGGNPEQQAHLKSCPVCSDLVADLDSIAAQAKLLVPMADPPPRVWQGIEQALEREGLLSPAGREAAPAKLRFIPGGWPPVARWASMAALLALAAGLLFYRASQPSQPAASRTPTPAVTAGLTSPDDQKILAAVADRGPAARERYRKNLETVNRAIHDASLSVQRDPSDEDAQDDLRNAYDQKALIYDMAMTRTAQ